MAEWDPTGTTTDAIQYIAESIQSALHTSDEDEQVVNITDAAERIADGLEAVARALENVAGAISKSRR